MKKNTVAGFVLTCVGDDRCYSLVESRMANTLADRVAKHVLAYHTPTYKLYSFLERGSDERQYCSPGVDLPVCSICRSKYDEYPEYHTSLDDLSLISPSGLQGSFDIYQLCIELIENNNIYRYTTLCEPQLGKRNLYPTISNKDTWAETCDMMNFIAYCDGNHSVLDILEKIGSPFQNLVGIIEKLLEQGVIEKYKPQ